MKTHIGIWKNRNGYLWFWDVWRNNEDGTITTITEARHGLDSAEDAQAAAKKYCEERGIAAAIDHPLIVGL